MIFKVVVAIRVEANDKREAMSNVGQLLADGGFKMFAMKAEEEEKK